MFALCLIPHVEKCNIWFCWHLSKNHLKKPNVSNTPIDFLFINKISDTNNIKWTLFYGQKLCDFGIPYDIFHGCIKWVLIQLYQIVLCVSTSFVTFLVTCQQYSCTIIVALVRVIMRNNVLCHRTFIHCNKFLSTFVRNKRNGDQI